MDLPLPRSPEELIAHAFASFERGDVDRLVSLATPQTIDALRSLAISEMLATIESTATAHEDPRIEGYHAEFGRLPSADEVRALSAHQLITWALAPVAPSLRKLYRAIGHVLDGDDCAYVLFELEWTRTASPTPTPHGVQIATCRQTPDGAWRLELDPSQPSGMPGYSGTWFYSTINHDLDT
jgi:hypothetical protein